MAKKWAKFPHDGKSIDSRERQIHNKQRRCAALGHLLKRVFSVAHDGSVELQGVGDDSLEQRRATHV